MAVMLLFPSNAKSQETPDNAIATEMQLSQERILQISTDMADYISKVVEVEDCIANASAEDVKDLQNRLTSIDVQWNAYTQIAQVEITASPVLMELLSNYKLVYTASSDSLKAQQTRLNAEATYTQVLAYLSDIKKDYESMLTEAERFALVPQTAAQLADVKAKEALIYAQVSERYQKALTASQVSETVKEQFPALEQEYIEITKLSEKIKSTVYKSWIERIKDYVLTLAGVAIILVFLNLVATKIKMAKQARDMAKKYGNILNRDEEYPTI